MGTIFFSVDHFKTKNLLKHFLSIVIEQFFADFTGLCFSDAEKTDLRRNLKDSSCLVKTCFLNPFDSQSETLGDTKFLTFDSIDRISFIGKLLSSALPWRCLFFNFGQFPILERLSILDLALQRLIIMAVFEVVSAHRESYYLFTKNQYLLYIFNYKYHR